MSKVLPLLDIQKMQFSDKAGAESWLLQFLKETEDANIEKVELQPKPESLNSINGFVTYANKERFFFKSHVEENEKVSEYYNASILAQAGYPVISARRIKQRPGQQIAFYEILSLSTLFDRLKEEEDRQQSNPQSKRGDNLVQAQEALDKNVRAILESTLRPLSAEQHSQAPIHQLFSHRLAEDGRFGLFYKNKTLPLAEGEISFSKLSTMRWQINGVSYSSTLQEIVDLARVLLAPADGPAVIGHGDAHNGNIFVNMDLDSGAPLQSKNTAIGPGSAGPKLVMFDPAFAGEHDPLLDITKPLFHNHFARWMYFPEQVDKEFDLSYSLQGDQISIEHSYAISPLRKQLLRIKIKEVVKPLIAHLHSKEMLNADWKGYLRCALFCCPFLTVNLLAPAVAGGTLSERYSLAIKMLALSMAVELGCEKRSGTNQFAELIDEILE
jgi:hypothetical protein